MAPRGRNLAQLCFLLLVGCPTEPAMLDTGPGVDAGPVDVPSIDVGPVPCGTDVVCPDDRPRAGAACLGALSCPYASMCVLNGDRFVCESGAWVFMPDPMCIGGGALPQAESCRTPSTATVAGSVELTPAADHFSWGPQGGAMVQFDLALTGDAAALECVGVEVGVRIDGVALPRPRLGLRTRCGRIAGVTIILSDQPCEDRMYEVVIDVDVAGVGTVSRMLMLRGGQMGGRPVCTTG